MSIENKLFLITGATSGIGKAAARAIACQGGRVVLAGRNPHKAAAVVAEIRQASGNPDVQAVLADFASLSEVRRLAEEFRQRFDRLDVLVNNAGAFFMRRRQSGDGLEMTFQVNYLSAYLLTTRLLDLLKASTPSRIVNVTSAAERIARPTWDDLQMARRYRPFQAYVCSKRYAVWFTYELARRLAGSGVTANALHPGMVNTGIWTGRPDEFPAVLLKPFTRLVKTPEQGAETTIYLATSPEVTAVTGEYFVDKRIASSSQASQDPVAAQRLWRISAALVESE